MIIETATTGLSVVGYVPNLIDILGFSSLFLLIGEVLEPQGVEFTREDAAYLESALSGRPSVITSNKIVCVIRSKEDLKSGAFRQLSLFMKLRIRCRLPFLGAGKALVVREATRKVISVPPIHLYPLRACSISYSRYRCLSFFDRCMVRLQGIEVLPDK